MLRNLRPSTTWWPDRRRPVAEISVTQTTLDAKTVPDPEAPHLVLWNTTAFYELRPELAAQRVQVDQHDHNGRLVASLVGARDGDRFISGASAPFGGPDFTREYEPPSAVLDAIRSMLARLRAHGVTQVEIRMKPPHSSATEPGILFSLLNLGFTVDASDINFAIDLTPFGDVDGYVRSLKPPARRAIRYGIDLGVITDVLPLSDDAAWFEAYEVLRVNRESKGRPMRLPFEYIISIRDAFPGLVRMVVARSAGTICAAGLLYRIAPGRDVVQYWGDARHELAHSPMNLLVRDVVAHALATGATVLDLGISTTNGVPNPGLIQFKRSVGARSEVRMHLSSAGSED
jgi:hypothetical protein